MYSKYISNKDSELHLRKSYIIIFSKNIEIIHDVVSKNIMVIINNYPTTEYNSK